MKKTPMRQCLGCREMKPKSGLLRVVKSPDGAISLDLTGKGPGRGAYVCSSNECFKRAVKTKAFSRAFGTQIPEEILEALGNKIATGDII